MSDKFKIDSHKAAFHPKHIYVVDKFAQKNKTPHDIEEFKKLIEEKGIKEDYPDINK